MCSDALDSKGSIDVERTGREFNLAFADFAIVYDKENQPVNPPSQIEGGLQTPILPAYSCAGRHLDKDPGTQLINYRNEPIRCALRRRTKRAISSRSCPLDQERGDLAHVFQFNRS